MRNKQVYAAIAAKNVRKFFDIRSKRSQSAGKNRWSADEEELLSDEFSKGIMEGEINLQKVKIKAVISPYELENHRFKYKTS